MILKAHHLGLTQARRLSSGGLLFGIHIHVSARVYCWRVRAAFTSLRTLPQ